VPATYVKTNIFQTDYPFSTAKYNSPIKRRFRYGLLKYTLLFGLVGAYLVTDNSYFRNDDLMSRPDYNQMRTLSNPNNIPIREKKVFEALHGNYFGWNFEEKPDSWWKRALHYFYPYYEYNPNENYYEPFFDFKKDYIKEEFSSHYHFKN
jgi:hypothetical protein